MTTCDLADASRIHRVAVDELVWAPWGSNPQPAEASVGTYLYLYENQDSIDIGIADPVDRVREPHDDDAEALRSGAGSKIGWAYARGGDVRRRTMPLIVEVVDV